MRSDVAYADTHLGVWASWVRGRHSAWPSRTLLGRVIEEGWGASQGSAVDYLPESILRTDRAVARVESILRHVLKVYYLTHAPSEFKAAACHCSRATFWRRVERGQVAVSVLLQEGETLEYKSGSSLGNSPRIAF